MTKYLHKEWTDYPPTSDEYRDNWEKTFGKKEEKFVCTRCDDWLPASEFKEGGIERGVCQECEK